MDDLGFSNDDMSANILSRLPTRSLLGLKCVNKEWQRLVSEPIFIKQKLKTKEPLSGFFFQERFQWCDEDIKAISCIKTSKNNTTGSKIYFPVFNFLPEDVVLLAVTNGLICCRSSLPCSEPVVYLCNPLNKEWVTLPCHQADKWLSLGLAFDPIKDVTENTTNFKVVRVHQTVTDTDDSYYSTYSFDIYSSKTQKWTNSKETCVCDANIFKNKGVCVSGKALFWLTDGDRILMFDTEYDVARLVKAPVPIVGSDNLPETCIGESEEKLHYVIISKEGILVWALEDDVDFNWGLKYFVDLDEMEQENSEFFYNLKTTVANCMSMRMTPYMNPLAYKDGVLLMRASNKIYLYNFDMRKMYEVCDVSDLGSNSMFSPIVLPFSMSLVPLAWP